MCQESPKHLTANYEITLHDYMSVFKKNAPAIGIWSLEDCLKTPTGMRCKIRTSTHKYITVNLANKTPFGFAVTLRDKINYDYTYNTNRVFQTFDFYTHKQ